ncbi:DoxX family protein [Labrys sp. KNU-23]|uniref:DoxX family protein n=1 Tax=Labrys sp. KNU-23 TaxID=2789216 RepID=UPI0011EF653C|nr:DoxX family protein [Labrys sp. KNU-23]QEN90671.1 DoxX family protein [Labrys sp. KNU-23]
MSQPSTQSTLQAYAPTILSLVRIVAGLIFLAHGTQKLFGFPALPPDREIPMFGLMWFGGILEAFGGLLIVIGLFTRPVAFILSGQMAVAYFMFHAPKSFFPALNGGDAAILYCFLFLYLVFAGPGSISVDSVRER